MAGEQPLNGSTKWFWIVLVAALGLGGTGAYSSNDASNRIEKLVDNLDTTLQREMRLITAPIDVRVAELGDDQDNMRMRINDLEAQVAANNARLNSIERQSP